MRVIETDCLPTAQQVRVNKLASITEKDNADWLSRLDEATTTAVLLRVIRRVDGQFLTVNPESSGLVLPRVRTL